MGFEKETIDYGESISERRGLGDPIGVRQRSRPTTESLSKWVEELTADAGNRRLMEEIIGQLDPADLETLGYPLESLWKPLEDAGAMALARWRPNLNSIRSRA